MPTIDVTSPPHDAGHAPTPGEPPALPTGEPFSATRRREFVGRTAVISQSPESLGATHAPLAPELAPLSLTVNGRPESLTVDTRTSLLDLLRERLHLTGTKKGCDHGQCGACTVIVDGRRINSCLALAVMQEGTQVTTVEGLGEGDVLHPVQRAFIAHDGFQCGYCTPGQICSAVALVDEVRAGWPSWVTPDVRTDVSARTLSDAEIAERMSGNLCRCGAYAGIHAAVRDALDAAGSDAS